MATIRPLAVAPVEIEEAEPQGIPDEVTPAASESAPSQAEAPPTKEEPVHKEADYVIPVAPELPTVEFAEEPKKKAKIRQLAVAPVEYEEEPKSAERPGFTGAVSSAFTGSKEAIANVAEMARIATLPEDQQVTAMQEFAKRVKPSEEPDFTEFTDIASIEDAWNFLKESAGQLAGSWGAASVYGGGTGAAAGAGIGGAGGALAGGVGAVPGAIAGAGTGFSIGTLSAFGAMGVGGAFGDLLQDEGVQAGLADGTITPKQVLGLSTAAGSLIGALDAVPAGKAFNRVFGKAGKEATKKTLRSILVQAAKGAGAEGSTEGLQQAITEANQALLGGDIDAYERAMAVVNAAATGAVGGAGPGVVSETLRPGAVEDTGITDNADETEEKTDDQPDRSNETQPEGTPADVDAAAAAGTATPGNVGATTPAQPAGTDKQPAPALEPKIPAVPQPEPKAQPAPKERKGVTVVTAGPDPALAAALGAPPSETEGLSEFDIEEEVAGLATGQQEIEEHQKRVLDLLRAQEQRTEKAAQRTKVAAAGDDIAAAMAAAQPPKQAPIVAPKIPKPAGLPPAGWAPPMQEANETYAPTPVTTENLGTGQALQPQPVEQAATLAEPAADAVATAEEATDQGVDIRPAQLPSEQAPALVPPEPAPELEPVPDIEPAVQPRTRPLAVAPIELTPADVAAFTPAAPPPQQRLPGKLTLKSTPGAAPAAPKGELYKRRKAVEAPTAQPTPQQPPAAPVGTRMAKDAATLAKESPELAQSTVSELKQRYHDTVDEVAREVTARRRAEEPEKSGLDIVRESVKEIADTVKQRLAAEQEANDAANVRAEEALTKAGRKKQAKEVKAEEMASGTGQQKERAKKGGKTATGIRGESEKATRSAVEQELTKPEAERDAALMEWSRLDKEQTALPATGIIKTGEHKGKPAKQVRESYKTRKAEQQEIRARAVEEAGAGMTERAKAAEKASKAAIATVTPLKETGSTDNMLDQANAFFLDFVAKTLKVPVSKKHDNRQSIEENLIVYARKVRRNFNRNLEKNTEKYQGIGPVDFVVAYKLYQEGATAEFNDMVVSEQLQGSGYSEAKGKDESEEGKQSWWRGDADEVSLDERVQRESRARMSESPDAIEEMRRGRNKAWEEARTAAAKEEAGYQDFRPVEITKPGGEKVTILAETEKASGLLKQLAKTSDKTPGFIGVLKNAHISHLIKLVGNVDVHFVTQSDMNQLARRPGASGLYYNYSNEERALGLKPQVFIVNDERGRGDLYDHTLLHELTHAATSQAIRDKLRGTTKILGRMRSALHKQLLAQYGEAGLKQMGLAHAFTTDAEFVAEAFSNQRFQELLAKTVVPASIRNDINALGRGSPPTWWQAFTAAVSNAIGMVSGTRGQTYMEQVIAISPQFTRSSATQQLIAQRETFGKPPRPLPRPTFNDMFDSQMMIREIEGAFEGAKARASDYLYGKKRWRDTFATTTELKRRAEQLFGGARNAFEKLADLYTKSESVRKKYRDSATGKGTDNREIEQATAELKRQEPAEYAKFGQWMDDATTAQVDGSVPLSHENNKHISKSGLRSADAREWHADLEKRFHEMSPAAQKLTKRTIAHYRKTRDIEVEAQIRYAIGQAMSASHRKPPPGKTKEDIVNWIRSGNAARVTEDQTAEDKAFHEALGNTAKRLAAIPELRYIKGVYMPKTRKGQFLITATERPFGTLKNPKNVPPGAILDAENRLLFANRKDYDAFVKGYPGNVHGSTRWVNAKTGGTTDAAGHKISSQDKDAVRLFVATVQNKRMEMSDSKSALEKRRAALIKEGHQVSTVRLSKNDLAKVTEEITSPQIKALMRNLHQTTIGSTTVGQQAIEGALVDAHVRTITSPSKMQRELKRKNILGNEVDPMQALVDYNRSLANGLANYELAPQIAQADHELTELMNKLEHSEYDDGKTIARQRMAAELRSRMNTDGTVSGPKALEAAKKLVYLIHLASPHYTAIQTTQIPMITMPILSGKYGRGAAWSEMRNAMQLGGVRASLGRGFKEFWAEGKRSVGKGGATVSTADHWRGLVKGQPDEAFLLKIIDEVDAQGLGATGGFETQEVEEIGMSAAGKALTRAVNVARALPQEIEGMNRYLTAIAAGRLELRKNGGNEDLAIREATFTVEESQGGYGAANNPSFFANPWLSPALQFRKFGLMMAQLYYGRIHAAIAGKDHETRVEARKTLAWISLALVAVAGVEGLPPVEIARMLVNLAVLLGFKEDDWEEDMGQLQAYIEKLTGQERLTEAMFHGLPRLLALDLSNSLGASSLLMFGQPDRLDPDGYTDWVAQAYGGAVGAAAIKSAKVINEADSFTDYLGAIPLPKIVANLKDSWTLLTKGTVDKKSGEEYMEPVGILEAGYKALGFRTASEARQWEAGGSGFENKQERKHRAERRDLMDRWNGASPGERARIFRTDVREWNRDHPDMKINMGHLHKSRETRRDRERERRKENN